MSRAGRKLAALALAAVVSCVARGAVADPATRYAVGHGPALFLGAAERDPAFGYVTEGVRVTVLDDSHREMLRVRVEGFLPVEGWMPRGRLRDTPSVATLPQARAPRRDGALPRWMSQETGRLVWLRPGATVRFYDRVITRLPVGAHARVLSEIDGSLDVFVAADDLVAVRGLVDPADATTVAQAAAGSQKALVGRRSCGALCARDQGDDR